MCTKTPEVRIMKVINCFYLQRNAADPRQTNLHRRRICKLNCNLIRCSCCINKLHKNFQGSGGQVLDLEYWRRKTSPKILFQSMGIVRYFTNFS